ncbi:hypothetical protein GXP70_04170 [Paenibacillus lycopersici]|uniref:Uncharacterized protein n=1 Tax=Paenibacillus lycopersici TaxID=2704462 RepID=A0A6C0FV18_9BACL|nr:hypothetical protein [Paenibacillus lycopersici]QHT59243.1 hypothetical protein GXP70_04170 [Paenibacillus lycopersici]
MVAQKRSVPACSARRPPRSECCKAVFLRLARLLLARLLQVRLLLIRLLLARFLFVRLLLARFLFVRLLQARLRLTQLPARN